MKHQWFYVLACAWILWEADVDPKSTLVRKMNALGGLETKEECVEKARLYAKQLDSAYGLDLGAKFGGKPNVQSHQIVGDTTVQANYKNGVHEVTRWECWPSDFDPRGK
jgi:hypothetical protein